MLVMKYKKETFFEYCMIFPIFTNEYHNFFIKIISLFTISNMKTEQKLTSRKSQYVKFCNGFVFHGFLWCDLSSLRQRQGAFLRFHPLLRIIFSLPSFSVFRYKLNTYEPAFICNLKYFLKLY